MPSHHDVYTPNVVLCFHQIEGSLKAAISRNARPLSKHVKLELQAKQSFFSPWRISDFEMPE